MPNLMFLVPLIAELLKKYTGIDTVVSNSKEQIKVAIHEEVVSISKKLIGGFVLSSLIVFSLICIGQQINLMLLALEYGAWISIALFSVVGIASAIALASIFRSRPKQKAEINLQAPASSGIDIQKIILTFFEGLSEGLHQSTVEKSQTHHKAHDETTNRI